MAVKTAFHKPFRDHAVGWVSIAVRPTTRLSELFRYCPPDRTSRYLLVMDPLVEDLQICPSEFVWMLFRDFRQMRVFRGNGIRVGFVMTSPVMLDHLVTHREAFDFLYVHTECFQEEDILSVQRHLSDKFLIGNHRKLDAVHCNVSLV